LDHAGLHIQVLHTPGHSPGGICLHLPREQVIFTGDTLFAGSCGRTDLPGGNSRTLNQSLARLADLPPETRIFPGHGPDSTIAHERQTNFFLVA
jgi:glyoxylase-like metal-dependent hydrolase (beta-lactamase superfamily II)